MKTLSTRSLASAVAVASLALVGACSSPSRQADAPIYSGSPTYSNAPVNGQYGRVTNIELVGASQRTTGAGAVLGAIVGGVVGNQVGSGSGRAAATGVGVVGGALIGNQIEKRRADDVYRVTVRYDNGMSASYDYERVDNLRIGDRVMFDNGNLRMM